MAEPSETVRTSPLWALLPLLAAVLAHAPALEGGFVWDDHALIEEQPRVQQLHGIAEYFTHTFWSDPFDPSRSFYRPVVTLSYALDFQLWRGSPFGFHLTNLLVHLAAVALVFALCRRAGADRPAAALASSFFAVFPRLTESVSWISGRTDVFACAFGLAALLLVFEAGESRGRRVGAAVLLWLSILSKEVGLAFVAGALVLEYGQRAKSRAARVYGLALPLAAALLALLMRLYAQHNTPALAPLEITPPLPFWTRFVAAFGALGEYARMIADPLHPELQIGLVAHPAPWTIIVGIGVAALAVYWFVFMARRGPKLPLALAVAGSLSLVMVLHLVPLNTHALAADRFLYVPCVMVVMMLIPLIGRGLAWRPRTVSIIAALVVGVMAFQTHARARVWSDEYSLWKEAVDHRDPRNSAVLAGLSGLLLDAELPERALPYLQQEIDEERAAPQLKIWNAFAIATDKAGDHEKAISLLEDLAQRQPHAYRVKLNLAMANARAHRWDRAAEVLNDVGEPPDLTPVVQNVREQLRQARAREEALAPGDESTNAIAERAAIADVLGATGDAESLYRRVLHAPDASQAQRLQAAGYLAFHGEPSRVKADLVFARSVLAGEPHLDTFDQALAARDRLR